MPGFIVDNVGDGVSNVIKPFYTYTWEIEDLFGTPAQDSVLIYARDCTLPTFTAGKEEVEGGGVVYKFAKMVNWEDVRITFYDIPVSGAYLGHQLRQWRRRVWNEASGIGMGSVYKKPSIIKVFNLDMSMEYRWTLVGSWPQSIRDGELTYTRTDSKLVEVVITYDWAEIRDKKYEASRKVYPYPGVV